MGYRVKGKVQAYPRRRGGTGAGHRRSLARSGLSPQARGNLGLLVDEIYNWGPIPAGAGEPRSTTAAHLTMWAYPRRRGGTDMKFANATPGQGLSPQARGNLFRQMIFSASPGPIPAGAGEPPRPEAVNRAFRAYPRRRGGTRICPWIWTRASGLSPQARGNLPLHPVQSVLGGPIPAGAGEPVAARRGMYLNWAYPRRRGGTSPVTAYRVKSQGLSPQARGNQIIVRPALYK